MTNFLYLSTFQQRTQFFQHRVPLELRRRSRVVVRQRHVGRLAFRHRERDADDARGHVIQAGGLGVEGELAGRLEHVQPGRETAPHRARFHRPARPQVRGPPRRRYGRTLLQLLQPALEIERLVQLAQAPGIRRLALQGLGAGVEFQVTADGGQLARQRQLLQRGAQLVADLALDLAGMLDHVVQRAPGGQPLGCSLRTHAGYARDVVRGVADQGEVIDDLPWRHAELLLHAVGIEPGAAHGVDQRDVFIDQLGHVLVAGGNDRVQAVRGSRCGQRADHIVRLDPLDLQQRQPQGPDQLQQRSDLGRQLVRHRRPVSLVLRIQVMAEGLAFRVEHHGDVLRGILRQQAAQHVHHPVYRPGRFAAGVGQLLQVRYVEGPVQVGRAIDQQQGSGIVGSHGFGIVYWRQWCVQGKCKPKQPAAAGMVSFIIPINPGFQ